VKGKKREIKRAESILLDDNPHPASDASHAAGPSTYVKIDDHNTGGERPKGKKRNKDRHRANDDAATDPVRIAKALVRKERAKHYMILSAVGTTCTVATVVSHGLAAPVFVLLAIAWERADKEIGAAEENLHNVIAEVNGMAG
jgi:hypothetical protein